MYVNFIKNVVDGKPAAQPKIAPSEIAPVYFENF